MRLLLHDVLLGAIIPHPHAHFLGCGDGIFCNAVAVEIGADPLLRIHTHLVSFFFDDVHLPKYFALKQMNYLQTESNGV